MVVPFDELIAPAPLGGDRFSLEIPAGWGQGRSTFGGLIVAAMVRAAERTAADPGRALRSLTAEIVGPVGPGPIELAAEILRAGTGATTVAVRLRQGGAVQAHLVAAFGKPRATYEAPSGPPPVAPPWPEVPAIDVPSPPGPAFTRHLEFRVTHGFPFSGATDREVRTEGWVRLRHPGTRRDGALVAALIDSYWPALLIAARGPKATATLTFALSILAPLDGVDPATPLYYRARGVGGGDGYAHEVRELWSPDGHLVALNQQCLVVMT